MDYSLMDFSNLNTTQLNEHIDLLSESQKQTTPPDTLKLEYPALASQIDNAISQGWDRTKLRQYLAERTKLALTQYTPQEVNQMLGRDENGMIELAQELKRQNDNSYVQIMKYDMSEKKVRDIINTAEYSGIAPSVLLFNPDLLPYAEKLAGERRGFFGHAAAAVANMIANYNQSSAGAELLDAQKFRNIMTDDNVMRDEGLRIWNAGLKTTLNPPPDDELIRMGRESYEKRAQNLEELAKIDTEDATSWATHVRPPDSAIGQMFISAIENSGFTIMSSLKSLAGWTFGGPVGGAISALCNTYDESQREAGEAFMEALRRGQSPEEAYNLSKEVYRNNMILLPITNYLGDWLVFGRFGKWSELAGRTITGKGIFKTIGRGALTYAMPAVSSSIPEGIEEYYQELFKMDALGDKLDPYKLWDAFKMGFVDSLIYSAVGLGGRAAINRAINWHNANNQNQQDTPTNQEIQEVIKPVADSIREIQDMSQQIQNGEVKPDDIVREDPFIFIPESRLDETTRQKLDIQDEILEDENGNIITPQNQENQQQDNNESESESESETQTESNQESQPDILENEIPIRKSTWDKFAAENPEMAASLQDVIRIGVKGVTAAEELANKFKNFVETANNNPEIKAEKERLFTELVNTGRNPQEARGLVDVAGAFADTLNKRYGVDVQQAMNLIAKSNNQVQENNNEAATPAPVITPATKQGSNTARIRTIQGTEIDIRYRIVEADSLITSNLENGGINPDYSQELQPRDRSRDASIEQIAKISTNLDPELLGESRLASDGAPIIGSDLMVESGNGRTLAIRQAYKNGTAQNYRNWLMNNAQYFGINPADIQGMKNPMLVRERISDIDRVKFSREANESSIAQMSASEIAMTDAKNLTFDILRLYDPNKSLENNTEFLKYFVSVIPQNERGNFYQSDGNISRAGIERARNALAAAAYNDFGILNRLSEYTDDEIKTISNALISAAPTLAIFENSQFLPQFSIRNDINNAVKTLAQIKEQGLSLQDYLAQVPMFNEDEDSQMVLALLNFLDENKNAYKRVANGLINYARLAMQRGNEGQNILPGMEDSVQVLRSEILRQAINLANNDVVVQAESYNQADLTAEQKLIRDEQAWSKNVDDFLNGQINSNEHIKIMDTPLVLKLIGAKLLPIYMNAGKINAILNKHPAITADVIKQIPRAITDPIAIFTSATQPNSIVVMTEITDKNGGTVIVPIHLDETQDNYQINRIASVYTKDKNGKTNNNWFINQVNNGNLLYLNNKKGSQWNNQTGLQLPVGSSTTNLTNSIPNENDLANLRNQPEFEGYYQTKYQGNNIEINNALTQIANEIREYKANNPEAQTMPADVFYDEILPDSAELLSDEDTDILLQELENNNLLVPANKDADGWAEEFLLPDDNLLAQFANNNISNAPTDLDNFLALTALEIKAFKANNPDTQIMPVDFFFDEIETPNAELLSEEEADNLLQILQDNQLLVPVEDSEGRLEGFLLPDDDTLQQNNRLSPQNEMKMLTALLDDMDLQEWNEKYGARFRQLRQITQGNNQQESPAIQQTQQDELSSVRSEPSTINPAVDESSRTISDNAGEITPNAEQLKNSDNNLATTPENVKARTSWPAGTSSADTQSIIEFFTSADKSSGFHELAHHIFRVLTDSAILNEASDELINDVETILKNAGVKHDDFYQNRNNAKETAHEYFARAFETYLAEGNAPTQELQSTFDKIKSWLIDIYHNVVQALGIELNDEMRNIFDKLLTTPEQEAAKLSIQDLQARLDATQQELSRTQNEISQLEQQIQEMEKQQAQAQREKAQAKIETQQEEIQNLKYKHKVDMLWAEMRAKEKLAKLKEKYWIIVNKVDRKR